jgi:hypothetical protein
MIQCLIIPSFIYTTICVFDGYNLLYREYIKNIDLQIRLPMEFEYIERMFVCDFYTLYTGPGPMLSLRLVLSFFKGVFLSSFAHGEAKKVVLVRGPSYYWYDGFDVIIIQNFSSEVIVLYSCSDVMIMRETELGHIIINSNFQSKKIGIVGRSNYSFMKHDLDNVAYILCPSDLLILAEGLKKYKSGEFLASISDIVVYKVGSDAQV